MPAPLTRANLNDPIARHMRDQVLLMVGNALLAQGDETQARNLIEELIVGSDAGRSFWIAGRSVSGRWGCG